MGFVNKRDDFFYRRGYFDANGHIDRCRGNTFRVITLAQLEASKGNDVVIWVDNNNCSKSVLGRIVKTLYASGLGDSFNVREGSKIEFYFGGSITLISLSSIPSRNEARDRVAGRNLINLVDAYLPESRDILYYSGIIITEV